MAVGSSTVELRWIEPEQVNDDNITGYQIMRNGVAIEISIIPSMDGSFFVYMATSLRPATVYSFQVAAINSVNMSIPATANATTADGSESACPLVYMRIHEQKDCDCCQCYMQHMRCC